MERGNIEALRVSVRSLLLGELATEACEHFEFELMQVISDNRLRGGDSDRIAAWTSSIPPRTAT
jgi:hypothetical protein